MIAGLGDPDGPNITVHGVCGRRRYCGYYTHLQYIICVDIIKREMLYNILYILYILNILRIALVKNRITRVYFIGTPVRVHTNDILYHFYMENIINNIKYYNL